MLDRLNAVRDIREPDYGDILLARACGIGANALAWAERCFASRDFPEQAFATVQGMIRLAAPRRVMPPSTTAVTTRRRRSLERGRVMQAGLLHQPAS